MLVAPQHQHDPGARADAAHADDLARRMDVAKALQQLPAVGAQGAPVGADHPAHELLELGRSDTGDHFLDRDDQRRVARDPGLAVDDLRELRERLQAVLRACLGQVALEPLPLLWGPLPSQRRDLVDVDAGVPDLEVGHRAERPDRVPVRTRHRPVDRPALFGVEASIPARHGEARHQPLQVPLERARQRLVEVVDAEHKPPIGRAERTEVGQVRIATELHLQPAPRRAGQIGRHRVGRAAEERERRHQHPPIADRHQLLHPRSSLLLQQLDRITPIGSRLPFALPRARRHRPRRLALCGSLLGGGVGYRLRPGVPPVALACPDRVRTIEGGLNVRHDVSLRRRAKARILPGVPSAPWNRSGADASSPRWHEIAAGARS